METALRHIGNFISTGDGTAEIYLHALDEHLNANISQRDLAHVSDTINHLLSKAKTRMLGLQLLDKVLPLVNRDLLEQKIQLWTTFILKACNQEELRKYGDIIYKSLTNLAHILHQYAELSKTFASNHLSKVYDIIAQSPAIYYSYALKCAETFLSTFPKPSAQSRETMERFLKSFSDTFDDEVNHCAGRCLHFLQQTTIPGSKDLKAKEQWKSYQLKLIESLSAVLDEAYSENSKRLSAENGEGHMIISPLKLSTEPNVRAAQIFVRFHNLAKYLRIALSEPNNNAACKPIVPKSILNLISRGLVVTCAALNQDTTYSKIAFAVFLPKIQLDLLELCKTIILTLHCNLRIYYKSLLGCLIHVLKSTSSTNKSVRTEVYNVIALWCQSLGEGSRCEIYADELVPELLKDISPVKNEIIPHIKTKDTHNKKAFNPLKRNTTKACLSNDLDEKSQEFYLAAIRCVQTILRSCACFLKPSTISTIQMAVLKSSASFYVIKKNEAYQNWRIRLEMYRLLYTILMTPNQYSPPPSEIVIYILRSAQSTESNTEIRLICAKMLEEIEKILHPQKESLIIPIEARVIRNAFSKIGQETNLEKLHSTISTLRYGQEITPIEEPYANGAVHTHAENVEAAIVRMEDNEDICENVATPHKETKATQIISPIKDQNKTTAVQDEILEAPTAKKQKFSQNYDSSQKSAATIDVSDDSCMEIENLKSISPDERNEIVTNDSGRDKITEIQKEEQPMREKYTLPKNDGNEIVDLEAYFVDELKTN